jgi:hypothetical protein
MLSKDTSFARYSRPLCWIVALISLLVAALTFTGTSSNAMLLGLLWLAVAAAFSLSALYLGGGQSDHSSGNDSGGEG